MLRLASERTARIVESHKPRSLSAREPASRELRVRASIVVVEGLTGLAQFVWRWATDGCGVHVGVNLDRVISAEGLDELADRHLVGPAIHLPTAIAAAAAVVGRSAGLAHRLLRYP